MLQQDVSLSDVWQRLGFRSLAQFRYHFISRRGALPGSLQPTMQDRIGRAELLLLEGRMPFAEIAREVGYAHYPSFATAFKNVHGMSCREWLASQRAQPQ